MEYWVGILIALFVVALATIVGLDRERAFYPTVLIIIASYYALFAVMGGSRRTLGLEIAVGIGFLLLAVVGFKKNLWLVAAAMVGHASLTSSIISSLKILEFRVGGLASVWRLT
jgi:hypothetical protein